MTRLNEGRKAQFTIFIALLYKIHIWHDSHNECEYVGYNVYNKDGHVGHGANNVNK